VISFCSCNLGAKALYRKKPPETALFRQSEEFGKKIPLNSPKFTNYSSFVQILFPW
jgi:hypothetical protein